MSKEFCRRRVTIDQGGGRTVGQIATVVGITVGAASKSVDRLEPAGWVVRSPNPRNRRSSLLALTEDGEALLARLVPVVADTLRPLLLDPLGQQGLDALAAAVTRLRAAIDAAIVV